MVRAPSSKKTTTRSSGAGSPVSVLRGDVWLIALDPALGSEIRKTRPCVVVSPKDMHDYLRTVIVAPMTTGSSPAPFRIALNFAKKDGLILLDQIRVVDKQRLVKRLGAVDRPVLRSVLDCLRDMFDE